MAETPTDNFDNHSENDFEKISAPGNGFDQEGDGLVPAADVDVDEPFNPQQDGEISTTTEASDNAGEDEAEEDRFNVIDASEVEGLSDYPEPLISLGDESQVSPQPRPQSISKQSDPFLLEEDDEQERVSEETTESLVQSPVTEIDEQHYAPEIKEQLSAPESEEIDHLSGPDSESEPEIIEQSSVPSPSTPEVTEQPAPELDLDLKDFLKLAAELEVKELSPALELVEEQQSAHEVEEQPSLLDEQSAPKPEVIDLEEHSAPEPEVEGQQAAPEVEDPVLLQDVILQEGVPNSSTQPSAPVPEPQPENVDQLIDFDNTSQDITTGTFAPSALPPSSNFLESDLIATDENKVSDSVHQNVFDSETDKPVTEQSAEETSKGCFLKGVDPRDSVDEKDNSVQVLVDLIYWRDVKKTGVVFGTMLTVLLCLAIFSLVSVLAYLSLALLTVSFSFVVYKKIMGAVQKSGDGHPFNNCFLCLSRCLLEMDINLKEDKVKTVIQALLNNINKTASELRRLFFIEDIVDSIKFGLMLWLSTYVGSWFNGITLVILAVISLFTLPKVYETYQVQIDQHVGMAKAQVNNVLSIVQSKVPFLKKKEKAQ